MRLTVSLSPIRACESCSHLMEMHFEALSLSVQLLVANYLRRPTNPGAGPPVRCVAHGERVELGEEPAGHARLARLQVAQRRGSPRTALKGKEGGESEILRRKTKLTLRYAQGGLRFVCLASQIRCAEPNTLEVAVCTGRKAQSRVFLHSSLRGDTLKYECCLCVPSVRVASLEVTR